MAVQNRLARRDDSDALGDTGNSKFRSVKYLLSNALIFVTAVTIIIIIIVIVIIILIAIIVTF